MNIYGGNAYCIRGNFVQHLHSLHIVAYAWSREIQTRNVREKNKRGEELMQKHGYFLGIDVGTQSLKIGIYNHTGKKLYQDQQPYPTYFDHAGCAEQDAEDWWAALLTIMSRAKIEVDLDQVAALAVCATSSTVLLTDTNGRPLRRAVCWMDQRATPQEESINSVEDSHVQDILQYAGGKVSGEWMTAKSIWFKEQGLLTKGRYLFEQLDWFNFRLTGKRVASKCNASCKWNYIEGKDGFSPLFFEKIGFQDYTTYWPSEVVKVGGEIAGLTEHAAAQLGLKKATPVYQGGIDAHVGMIGSNAISKGKMSLITGTSFVHLIHHHEPVFQPGLWGPYQAPLIDDHWLLEGGQLSCGSLISWFFKEFEEGVKTSSKFNQLIAECQNIPPGSEGLVMLDSWQGNRTPYRNPHASGGLIGLTLAHSKYHIFRAILESTAYGTKNVIETFQKSGIPVDRIVAGGGGTKNELWLQIISDVTGISIETTTDTETGARGAAIIAAYGAGYFTDLFTAADQMVHISKTYSPNRKKTMRYQDYYQLYLELNRTLFPVMKELRCLSHI